MTWTCRRCACAWPERRPPLGQAVEPELWMVDVENVHAGEAGAFGVVAEGVGTHDGAGADTVVLDADGEAVQRAEAVEEPFRGVRRDGERRFGPLVDDQYGCIGAGEGPHGVQDGDGV